MKRSWWNTIGCFCVAALLSSSAWASIPPQPGTVNYVEGQASINGQPLNANPSGPANPNGPVAAPPALATGQTLETGNGRAEILLTPGIFLRVADNSAVQIVSPNLADTIASVQKGRAMVEVAGIRPQNNVRIMVGNVETQLLKAGLYDFDANRGTIRVFDGKAAVEIAGRHMNVDGGHQLAFNVPGNLKTQKFDRQASVDDFYRWGSLRSSYLAEANVDAARSYGGGSYAGGNGWAATPWYGNGWYWDGPYGAYTYIPADGIFYDPFGWGFYSPWLAFNAPFFGFGYGFYGGGYYHHFGPGYHPSVAGFAGNRSAAFVGHAQVMNSGMAGRGFAGGGARSVAGASSFRGGGGGGFAGGGFHGGGGFGGGRR